MPRIEVQSEGILHEGVKQELKFVGFFVVKWD